MTEKTGENPPNNLTLDQLIDMGAEIIPNRHLIIYALRSLTKGYAHVYVAKRDAVFEYSGTINYVERGQKNGSTK